MSKWALEYSLEQNAYHIEELDRVVLNNQLNILKGVRTGYQIIGLYDNHDDALAFMYVFRERQKNFNPSNLKSYD